MYFTGSKPHNIHVRTVAVRAGLKLSEYSLFDAESGQQLAAATEEDVYGYAYCAITGQYHPGCSPRPGDPAARPEPGLCLPRQRDPGPVAGHDRGSSPVGLVLAARRAGVADDRVLAAIRATPRAAFVPAGYAAEAYADRPLPIPHGQVTTQPSLSAVMIVGLGLSGGEQVLEIGTGYGYQTALLSRLATHVVSIEIWPDIAAWARRRLRAQGIRNVLVVTGDGTEGYLARAPYDVVLVSAAFPQVPPPLASQLRAGGRLVQPVGPGGLEQVVLFERRPEGLKQLRLLTPASFVRLYGKFGFPHMET